MSIYLNYLFMYVYMNKFIKTILIISILILSIDGIVLSLIKKIWKKTIEDVQHKPFAPKVKYAICSYLLLIFGLYYFVYRHINQTNWIYDTLINGFLFGFILYGVFDFTNLAIFTDYSLFTGIIDMIWGGMLMSITAFTTFYILNIKH